MLVNTITQAKAQLSSLVELVLQGEEVVIARAGKPVAVLKAYQPAAKPRVPGRLKGRIKVADDFDELPPELAGALGLGDTE